MNTNISERKSWLDIARGIAIILVIIGHTFPRNSPMWVFIFSFHMPLFFIVSGYLFKPKPLKLLVNNNFKRILLPYLSTGLLIIFLIFLKYAIKIPINLLGSRVLSLLCTLLYGSGVNLNGSLSFIEPIGALWFLLCIFFTSLFFNIIIMHTQINKFLQPLIIFGLGLLGYLLGQIFFLPLDLDISLVSLIFFYCGYIFKSKNIFELKQSKFLFVILLLFWGLGIFYGAFDMAARIYPNFIIACISSICGSYIIIYFSLFISKFNKLNKILSYIGQETLVILCFHALELKIIPWSKILDKIPYSFYGILSLVKIVLLVLIAIFIKKIPFIRSLYYYKKYPLLKNSNNTMNEVL